jgi:hypothetical protein
MWYKILTEPAREMYMHDMAQIEKEARKCGGVTGQ